MDFEHQVSTDELINALSPLIESGRITGYVLVDGVIVLNSGDQNRVDPPGITYDEFGFSDHNEHGCVRNKTVDEFLEDWTINGDVFQQAAAHKASQYFGVLVPGREYTEEQKRQVYLNNQNLWSPLGIARFGVFFVFGDRYWNKATGETSNIITKEQMDGEWSSNPHFRGETIANQRAVGWGNAVDPNDSLWREYMTEKLPTAIISLLTREANTARRRAENGPGVREPNFGPPRG